MSADPVRLTIVPHEIEAEMLCGMLRAAGIECMQRITDMGFGAGGEVPSQGGGSREVLVHPTNLEVARELVNSLEEAPPA